MTTASVFISNLIQVWCESNSNQFLVSISGQNKRESIPTPHTILTMNRSCNCGTHFSHHKCSSLKVASFLTYWLLRGIFYYIYFTFPLISKLFSFYFSLIHIIWEGSRLIVFPSALSYCSSVNKPSWKLSLNLFFLLRALAIAPAHQTKVNLTFTCEFPVRRNKVIVTGHQLNLVSLRPTLPWNLNVKERQ